MYRLPGCQAALEVEHGSTYNEYRCLTAEKGITSSCCCHCCRPAGRQLNTSSQFLSVTLLLCPGHCTAATVQCTVYWAVMLLPGVWCELVSSASDRRTSNLDNFGDNQKQIILTDTCALLRSCRGGNAVLAGRGNKTVDNN